VFFICYCFIHFQNTARAACKYWKYQRKALEKTTKYYYVPTLLSVRLSVCPMPLAQKLCILGLEL